MKTLTFTDDEIETLCRGLLALTDDNLLPAIALHAKLVGPAPRPVETKMPYASGADEMSGSL